MCDSARVGTIGTSVEEDDVVEERGWLVTVTDRFGKYEVEGFASMGNDSCGEASGVVIEEAKLCGEMATSESNDEADEVVDEIKSGAL